MNKTVIVGIVLFIIGLVIVVYKLMMPQKYFFDNFYTTNTFFNRFLLYKISVRQNRKSRIPTPFRLNR